MKKGFSLLTAMIASFVILSSFNTVCSYAGNTEAEIDLALSAKRVKSEILVKAIGVSIEPRAAKVRIMSTLTNVLGRAAIQSVTSLSTDSELYRIKMAKDQDLKQALVALNADPMIKYAEPNYIYHALDTVNETPNDPELNKLWGLKNTGQADADGLLGISGSDINVLPLWKEGLVGSRDVTVAVIDTGVDWNHPDLVNNIYTNTKEIPGNNIDDDNNGFIDDVHGWNFAGKNSSSLDDHDHGTHCAGTIGAEGNNSLGVVGVNWKVSILPVKFLDAGGGGSLADAVDAINYARKMKVQVMSNSWGGGPFSQAMKDAIEETRKDGILFIAAAGNESTNNDSSPSYPASYDIGNVISVAATNNQDQIASFSNYGSKTVHVAAPGVKIYSTVRDGKYGAKSGTSMATPHVAGIVALMRSIYPQMDVSEIKSRLIKTSTPVQGLKKKVIARGRVNVFNAVNNIVPPSSEPDESLWKTVDYAVESPHPYKDRDDLKFQVNYPGAKYIRVIFDRVETEENYDRVTVEDSKGATLDSVTGTAVNYTSEYVNDESLTIRLKADISKTGFGFKVSKIQVIMK
jgi:subtilisin family serine protease